MIVLLGLHPTLPDTDLVRYGYGGIGVCAAGFLLVMFILSSKPKKIAWYLSVLFFVAGVVAIIV